MKYFSSRIARKQIRRIIFFGFLSVFLILAIFWMGIPLLIKVAVFLGNIRTSSNSEFYDDRIAPSPPKLVFPFEATNSGKINFKGFAEPESKVEILLNGIFQKRINADKEGNFYIEDFSLSEGENEITVVSIDKAGNTSQPSEKLTVVYDSHPPELIIIEPENGAKFYGPGKMIEIRGETEENVSVMINEHFTPVDHQGRFIYLYPLSRGENKIKIVAIDKAGNQTEKELTILLE